MSSIVREARVRAEVDALADVVESLGFRLATDDQPDRRARRDRLARVLRRHLEPRLASPRAPLVVALFGPTGSGKSTILNTLAGRPISRAGVLRPTTTRAVVWVHQRHADSAQVEAIVSSGPAEIVADSHPILLDLIVVDTPDIDSVAEDHRIQTTAILESADAAVAVTTPQRYADAVPWEVLSDLTERSLDLVVVMNRAARRSSGAVSDLASLLRQARVGGVRSADDIVVVQEQRIRSDGRLHQSALRRLSTRLEALAADRPAAARRGLAGSGRYVVDAASELADAVRRQADEADALSAIVDDAAHAQRAEITSLLETGDLVRDEVVERWQRLVGVSDLAEMVTSGVVRLRRLVAPGGMGRAARVTRVEGEVRGELVDLGMRRAERARVAVELAWTASGAGSVLLAEVSVDAARVRDELERAVEEWQAEVVALVAGAGEGRFRYARAASIGINAAAIVLLLGVFASTGGITGAEVGVAAGAAAAQQTVLEKLFGSAAALRLAKSARALLAERLEAAVEGLLAPYRAALGAVIDDPGRADALHEASARMDGALAEYLRA